jgi:ribosomal protein S18 acetylase RimI-like enzyme
MHRERGMSMSGVLVREAEPLDEAAASRLEAEVFAALRSVYIPVRTGRVPEGGSNVPFSRLVAEGDGQIVGTVRWRVEGDRVHLRALAVAPGYRQRGVARALVTQCVEMARQRRLRAVSAYTVVETGNVRVFGRLGFAVVRQEIDGFATTPAGLPVTEAYLELRVS